MLKLKQKLRELFSFLWNEFPKRYSSKALLVYTILTTVMIWWPYVLGVFLEAINSPFISGTGGDGIGLIIVYSFLASIVFNIFFGVLFYILLYYENKHKDFRLKLKKDSVNKFYRAILTFIFLLFTFNFLASLIFILTYIVEKDFSGILDLFGYIYFALFSPFIIFNIHF